jgi:hypothetical protein
MPSLASASHKLEPFVLLESNRPSLTDLRWRAFIFLLRNRSPDLPAVEVIVAGD